VSTYLVNEMYPCLQGEGPQAGSPSLLVRFQICNLRCGWCDTPYTHTLTSDSNRKATRWPENELISEIALRAKHKKVIFTGGEPTLHNLSPLMSGLLLESENWSFEVETNGTQIPHEKFNSFLRSDYALAQWNVSPKGNNAGEKWDQSALQFWADLSHAQKNVFFKFVLRESHAAEDLAEVKKFESDFKPALGKIYLMPEGTSLESQTQAQWLHDMALEHGYCFASRLHVILFGNKRGV
jgi:7-carboxy-7-deazaguanine synthase